MADDDPRLEAMSADLMPALRSGQSSEKAPPELAQRMRRTTVAQYRRILPTVKLTSVTADAFFDQLISDFDLARDEAISVLKEW